MLFMAGQRDSIRTASAYWSARGLQQAVMMDFMQCRATEVFQRFDMLYC